MNTKKEEREPEHETIGKSQRNCVTYRYRYTQYFLAIR